MRCIFCDGLTAVVDKRTSMDNVTRRRRKCLVCSKRFTTKEVLLEDFPDTDKVPMPTPKTKVKVAKVSKPKPAKPLSPEKQKLIELFTRKKNG